MRILCGELCNRHQVRIAQLIEGCYAVNAALGLLMETAAVTGARLSQLVRIRIADLDDSRPGAARLQVPPSRKGGRKVSKPTHIPVPIPCSLAARLRAAGEGRPPEALLLLRSDGSPWGCGSKANHGDMFREAVRLAGFDPNQDGITSYVFRHSAIKRWLLAGTPVMIVAKQADTSVTEINKHYGRYILEFSDSITRAGMFELPRPVPLLPPSPVDNQE